MKNFFRVVLMMLLQHTRKIFSWEFRIFSRPVFFFLFSVPLNIKTVRTPINRVVGQFFELKKPESGLVLYLLMGSEILLKMGFEEKFPVVSDYEFQR